MPPAARITDMHTCPMQTPAFPSPIPHVGGPVVGPCVPNVLIGKLPAAVIGDSCVCVGPPDTIAKGSATVMIGARTSRPHGRYNSPRGFHCFGMHDRNDRRINKWKQNHF